MRGFPHDARQAAGFQLGRVQAGLEPEDWKSIPAIGAGVREIRLHRGGAFRVIYLATHSKGVFVLHCFEKKTRKTAVREIELARQRFKQIGD